MNCTACRPTESSDFRLGCPFSPTHVMRPVVGKAETVQTNYFVRITFGYTLGFIMACEQENRCFSRNPQRVIASVVFAKILLFDSNCCMEYYSNVLHFECIQHAKTTTIFLKPAGGK